MAYWAGALWVADHSSGTVTKVDRGTGKPSATVTVGGSPSAIGGWVASCGNSGCT
jgi:YVTN family beta-propeller protein